MLYMISVVVLLSVAIPIVHAETDSLWVPDKMIAGEAYHGTVITNNASSEGLLAFLSTDDDSVIRVPDTVPILPHENHGVFEILPVSKGNTEVFAAVGGKLYRQTVEVFSPHSEPSNLGIVLAADKTGSDSILAYVTVSDQNGMPVPVNHDTHVTITTTGAVVAPDNITIQSGTASSPVGLAVRGTGGIVASADTLESYSANIEKVHDDLSVKVAVAPKVAMPESYVFYYIWLEKNGMPYRPPYVVDAFIQSGDSQVGRFDENPTLRSGELHVHLVGGQARGLMYTGSSGHVAVTVSADGFGHAQDSLFVGSARLADYTGGDLEILLHEQDLLGAETSLPKLESNALVSWVYPPITDGDAWAVVATYHADVKTLLESVRADDFDTQIIHDTLLTPTDAYDNIIHASSVGLEHDNMHVMESHHAKTNALEFPIHGTNPGTYKLTVSGQNLMPHTVPVEIVSDSLQNLRLDVIGVPLLPHRYVQDIAMISVLDQTGATVDIREILESGAEFSIHSDSLLMPGGQTFSLHANSATVSGILADPATAPKITAVLDGVGSATIDASLGREDTYMEVLAPQRVHVGEEFPFTVHEMSSLDTPIRKITSLNISSDGNMSIVDGHMLVLESSGTSTSSLVSGDGTGAAEYEFSGFENAMEAWMHLPKIDYRIDEAIRLIVDGTVDGALYELITDFPFVQADEKTFLITPDQETESSTLTVIASSDGYETVSVSKDVTVREAFIVRVDAVDSEKNKLQVPFVISANGTVSNAVSPYYAEHRPGPIKLSFEDEVSIDGRGYILEEILADGIGAGGNIIDVFLDGDVLIAAEYDRVILVDVIGGTGSGVYRYGDMVRVTAQDREIVSFLIRDVFVGWVGLEPHHTSSDEIFVATKDMHIVAMYREDYTYLMLVVLIPLAAGGVYVTARNFTGFGWFAQNILERVVPAGKIGISKMLKRYQKNTPK